jgi:hypothetical protein
MSGLKVAPGQGPFSPLASSAPASKRRRIDSWISIASDLDFDSILRSETQNSFRAPISDGIVRRFVDRTRPIRKAAAVSGERQSAFGGDARFGKFIGEEVAKWAKVDKFAGIGPA